jgi:hypothetical protein
VTIANAVTTVGTDIDLAVKEEKFFEKRPALAQARLLPKAPVW